MSQFVCSERRACVERIVEHHVGKLDATFARLVSPDDPPTVIRLMIRDTIIPSMGVVSDYGQAYFSTMSPEDLKVEMVSPEEIKQEIVPPHKWLKERLATPDPAMWYILASVMLHGQDVNLGMCVPCRSPSRQSS